MERALGLGIAVMIAADAVVGARLLLLGLRGRRLPELAFGSAFLLLGVVGYPLSIVARGAAPAGAGLLAAALAAQDLGSLAMGVATWRTFRPREPWARRAVGLLAAALLVGMLGDSVQAGAPSLRDGGPWYYVGFAGRAGAFLWAALEALRYHGMMRRRLVLGLADPVVTDRFRLWAISSLGVCAAFATFLVGRLTADNVATSAPVLLVTSVAGIVAGVAMLLAFVPPAAYVRSVAERARRRGTPGADAALREAQAAVLRSD